jgi:uncharacterized membrane protein
LSSVTSRTAIARLVLRLLAVALFLSTGVAHFIRAERFVSFVPPALPAPRVLVFISGVAEIAGAIGLLIPPLRRWAGYGLIALLIAVFPANIYMAVHPERFTDVLPAVGLWIRLPFQLVFIAWVWWVSRPNPSH